MTSLWLRALLYMVCIGGSWLVALPVLLLRLETGAWLPGLRPWFWVASGAALFAVGIVLAGWAGWHLVEEGRGTPFPLDRTRRLVVSGPYAYVRNPQALAMVFMVCGEILAVRSGWLWVTLPLTLVYLEGLVGPLEERQLERTFGEAYRHYTAHVLKWLPRRVRYDGRASWRG